MQIITYSELKHRILYLTLPLNKFPDLKSPHIPINYIPYRKPDPSTPFNQFNDSLSGYSLLSKYDLNVRDPCFSDEFSYLVIVSLNGSAFWVLRLVIQDYLQVAHLFEVLAAETNDVFELVESVD
jgi:hypothetical protein